MTGIILAIIAIILAIIAFIISVINSDIIDGIFILLLACCSVFLLKCYLDIYNEPQEIQTTIVKDIQGFSIDSTLTISGADTTKTYILTYWK